MHFKFDGLNGRHQYGCSDITDEAEQKVGYTKISYGNGRFITMFDGKYEATLDNEDQCRGFMRGVAAVLNRMTSVDDGRGKLERKHQELRDAQNGYPARRRKVLTAEKVSTAE